MKVIVLLMMVINLYAGVEVKQNIKALYRNVNLSDTQKDYILENKDTNIEILKKSIKKELKKSKLKYMDEKDVVSFTLNANGTIKKIKFLRRSDNSKFDKIVKKSIQKINKKLEKTDNKIELRFIISYKAKQKNTNNYQNRAGSETYYTYIPRGTTRFEYSSKEYMRVFETSKDGFINMTQNPRSCAKYVTILKENGQKLTKAMGNLFSEINKEAPKGKYKILIQTKKDCNINLQYP